jgi:hypothetical protein
MVEIGGGCSAWLVGSVCWWRSATGRIYYHSGSNGCWGECGNGWVYFYHIVGDSGWHYCP